MNELAPNVQQALLLARLEFIGRSAEGRWYNDAETGSTHLWTPDMSDGEFAGVIAESRRKFETGGKR